MPEHRLGTGESLSPDLIAQRGFTTNRKGFDPGEVKAFLASVADTVRDLREQLRISETARRDAEERALHPKIDEEMLLSAVGEETTTILRTARAASGDIRAKAEEQAAALLRDAQSRAESITADAESAAARVRADAESAAAGLRADAEEAATTLRAKVDDEAERIRSTARHEAEAVRQLADQERKMTVEAAQQMREQILSDLTRRRRVANTQIEQLRAGRERLLDAYVVVRRTLDEVTDELQRADGEARQAAEDVAKRAASRPSDDLLLDLTPDRPQSTGVLDPGALDTGAVAVVDAATAADDALAAAETGAASETGSTKTVAPETAAVTGTAARDSRERATGPVPIPLPVPALEELDEPTAVFEVIRIEPEDSEVAAPAALTSPANEAQPDSGDRPAGETVSARSGVRSAPPSGTRGQVVEARDEMESVRVVPAGGGQTGGGQTGAVAAPARERSKTDRLKTGGRRGPSGGRAPQEESRAPVEDRAVLQEDRDVQEDGSAPEDRSPELVDSLFARIRADRADAVVKARSVLDDDPESEPDGETDAEAAGAEQAETGLAETGQHETGQAETGQAVQYEQVVRDEQVEGGDQVKGGDQVEEEPVSDSDEDYLQRRDEATADIEVALARRLKRALQDEQNDLLDRLRQVRGTPKAANLLPKAAEQRGRYTTASRPHLDDAAKAGVAYAGAFGSGEAAVTAPNVDDLAVGLAAAVSDPLRRRLQQAFAESAGDEQHVLIEALGAVYRECKTQRIEQVAGDHVTGAFARGAYAATPDGTRLRWLAEDLGGPCPDCDDNVLAGGLTKGDEYPTGQTYPPAHAGCRCILVPFEE